MRYVGVDGCKNGWVAVWLDTKGAGIQVYEDMEQLWAHHSSASFILIDIPIGLVDEGDSLTERKCDREARKLLGRKSSSLFSAPSRPSLYAVDYVQASQRNFLITGKKLSKQSFYLIPKIKEVDEFLMHTHAARPKLRESHPELCFRVLSGNQDLDSKKSESGQAQRLALLKKYEPLIASLHLAEGRASLDDVLDAAVLAVTARLSQGIGLDTVCAKQQEDSKGLLMNIAFFKPKMEVDDESRVRRETYRDHGIKKNRRDEYTD